MEILKFRRAMTNPGHDATTALLIGSSKKEEGRFCSERNAELVRQPLPSERSADKACR